MYRTEHLYRGDTFTLDHVPGHPGRRCRVVIIESVRETLPELMSHQQRVRKLTVRVTELLDMLDGRLRVGDEITLPPGCMKYEYLAYNETDDV